MSSVILFMNEDFKIVLDIISNVVLYVGLTLLYFGVTLRSIDLTLWGGLLSSICLIYFFYSLKDGQPNKRYL